MRYFFYKLFFALSIAILSSVPFVLFAQSSKSLEQELQRKLKEITTTINSYRSQIQQLGKVNRTLQEEMSLLDKKNETLELQIQAGEISLQSLKDQVIQLRLEILAVQEQLDEAKQKLSTSITQLYQYDQRSGIEMVFAGDEFSDFFDQVHYIKRIQENVKEALQKLADAKALLDEKEENLQQRLAAQQHILTLQQLQQEEIENNKKKKGDIINKNTATSGSLAQKSSALEGVAQQLKQQLYVLKGLTTSVSLADAHQKAQAVAAKVNINPDFLMAILKVESDFGNNVGGGNWQADMHPRDRDAFAAITAKLGLNPNTTPVSRKPSYGWGGAMGPAQFLPAVWLSYEARIAELTGRRPPNPWLLEDAFAAAAIKLSKDGANQKTPEGEWAAAMKYFAGGNWKNPAYAFYGDRVMAIKELIAAQT